MGGSTTKRSRLAFFTIIGGALTISGAALAAAPPVYNHSIRAVALGENGCLAATNQHPEVVPNHCTSYEGQRWNVTRLTGDRYAIRHPHSGLCLTVTAQEQGALVVLYPCHDTTEQQWRAVLSGPEYYRICCPPSSGRCERPSAARSTSRSTSMPPKHTRTRRTGPRREAWGSDRTRPRPPSSRPRRLQGPPPRQVARSSVHGLRSRSLHRVFRSSVDLRATHHCVCG
ncbi:RICIN domain-containing protein [Sorangium sp. So ce854]|uniref:RICIN domain-containing protein n=1 Tax=Sorangium sp. So ce854 TaxID=3133322 RepID=UPI003F5D723E